MDILVLPKRYRYMKKINFIAFDIVFYVLVTIFFTTLV